MAGNNIDISQLNTAQQEALQQFTSVTDQEPAAAIPLLQRSEWNVPIAIAKFFDGEGNDILADAQAAQNVPPPRAARHENLQQSLLSQAPSTLHPQHDPAPRIVPQSDDQVTRQAPFILALFFTPFSIIWKILSGTFGLFSFLFPFLPRALQPNPVTGTARRPNTSGRRALKPRDAAARLKREFEEEYGEHSLPLYEGGYAQALDAAKKDLKFLLILLTSPEHDDTSSWIREVLLSSEVQSFFNDPANDIILWAGDVRDAEAYQVSGSLRCNKFPFTAVVAHTPQQSATSMSVLTRLTGPMPATAYIARLRTSITAHSEQLRTVRETRNAQNFERTLRQEQDSAYERSLAQDRERARLKKEAAEQLAAQEKAEKDALEAAGILAAKKLQWRKWRASAIEPEPSTDAKDVVRIALKMPEAARIMRRFPSTATFEELYAFVECYEFLQSASNAEEKPEDYDHVFDFRLVSTLPRVVYDPQETQSVGAKIGRSGNLIVEAIEEEE